MKKHVLVICHDQKNGGTKVVKAKNNAAALRAVGTAYPDGTWSVTGPEKDGVEPDIDAMPKSKVKTPKVKPDRADKQLARKKKAKLEPVNINAPGYVKVDDYLLAMVKENNEVMTVEEMAKDVSAKYPRLKVERSIYWLNHWAKKEGIQLKGKHAIELAPATT